MSPADALAGFLTALLPSGTEIPLAVAERAARFRTEVAGRRMLVLLDNAATVEQIRGHGDRDGETWSLNGLGEAYLAAGNAAAAQANHAQALTVATRTGGREQEARAHRGLARTATADTARLHYDRAIATYTELGLLGAKRIQAELADLNE